MGILLHLPTHRCASVGLKPKMARSNSLPWRSNASVKVMKYSGGIAPRDFQLDTAGTVTPAKAAAAVTPPTASITASTELSMELDTSRNVKMSSLHEMPIDCSHSVRFDCRAMQSNDEIADRLKMTRSALGLSNRDMAKLVGCTEGAWSQFEAGGDRRITLTFATELRKQQGITLDWIYCGDLSGLPLWIVKRIKEINEAKEAGEAKEAEHVIALDSSSDAISSQLRKRRRTRSRKMHLLRRPTG